MNLFESLIYGLVSGLTEFLPISSRGHQILLKTFFGVSSPEPIRDILIHFALLLAVLISCGTYIDRLRRDHKSTSASGRKRPKHTDKRAVYDLRLLKSACLPMLIGMLFYGFTANLSGNLGLLALFFAMNGLLVYIPEHLPRGNKDSGILSALDAFLLGLLGAFSVLPGVSRVGASLSCAIARGADQGKAYNWILVLSIPALLLLLLFDFIGMFSTGIGAVSFIAILGYLLSAVAAFGAALAGIYLMRFLAVRSIFSAFGFYSWGTALLSFLLYLFA